MGKVVGFLKEYRLLLLASLAVIVIAIWAINVQDWPDFTGFNGKTIWDLTNLAIVPILVALVAYYLDKNQKRTEEVITTARGQEAELQSYLDRMTDLLLRETPYKKEEIEARDVVVRARTLSVLKNLDASRKASILRFLYESKLLNVITDADFSHVDMYNGILLGAYLFKANFNFANLSFANLEKSVLSDCSFYKANLSFGKFNGVDLSFAKLRGADLSAINLVDADLSDADLTGAKLRGADLTNANLVGTDLSDVNLEDVNLYRVKYNESTKWPLGFAIPEEKESVISLKTG